MGGFGDCWSRNCMDVKFSKNRWFYSYDKTIVRFEMKVTHEWRLYKHFWPFFAFCMVIFHKTEIQTVILRCLTSLNLDWYRSYDTKRKNTKNTNVWFCTKPQKTWNGNICVLCPNFWTIQNLDQLNTSKWPSAPQFCERWTYTWQKTGWKW